MCGCGTYGRSQASDPLPIAGRILCWRNSAASGGHVARVIRQVLASLPHSQEAWETPSHEFPRLPRKPWEVPSSRKLPNWPRFLRNFLSSLDSFLKRSLRILLRLLLSSPLLLPPSRSPCLARSTLFSVHYSLQQTLWVAPSWNDP